ncbi:hypothetical protein F4808DRAFT_417577 [Astrocystis sublimbata]|nr:hypothetical protein F4808DRAFT_417577 [Astrocystis sublimbata]
MVSLWSAVQMFVSLLCCCLPVCKPILPSAAFWNRVSTRMTHYLTFGRDSNTQATGHSAKTSHGSGGHMHSNEIGQDWERLDDNSTRALAWPSATYQMEARALSDPKFPAAQSGLEGIQMHKQIDITRMDRNLG